VRFGQSVPGTDTGAGTPKKFGLSSSGLFTRDTCTPTQPEDGQVSALLG